MQHRLVALCALSVALSPTARAFTTYQVNSTDDAHDAIPGNGICQTVTPGICTLRAAVEEANVTGGVIGVPAGTYTLPIGQLGVTHDMTLQGAGSGGTVITGGQVSRIFQVTSAGVVTLTLRDLTLRDGKPADAFEPSGGAISSGQHVTLQRCLLTGNQAAKGGAISCGGSNCVLTIEDTDLSANQSSGIGGAVAISRGSLTLTRSTIHGNTAGSDGGGLAVTNELFSDAFAVVVNSTIGSNTAAHDGGGVFIDSANNLAATVRFYNATVVANRATSGLGGGIAAGSPIAPTIRNTIVAYNTRTSKGSVVSSDCSGTISSEGNSIVSGICTATGSYTTVSPLLGPLQNNGGHAPTYALVAGSAAIDAGTEGGCYFGAIELTTDERGVKRLLGARCDIGAYEQAPCGDADGDGSVTLADIFFVINHLFAGGPVPPGLANVDGDADLSVGDAFYLINALFAGGPAPTCPGT
jgi:CSLREA domain-containing protein